MGRIKVEVDSMDEAQKYQSDSIGGCGKTKFGYSYSGTTNLNSSDLVKVLTLQFGTSMFYEGNVWTGTKITDYLFSQYSSLSALHLTAGEKWDETKLNDYILELSKPEQEVRLTEDDGKVCVCIKKI